MRHYGIEFVLCIAAIAATFAVPATALAQTTTVAEIEVQAKDGSSTLTYEEEGDCTDELISELTAQHPNSFILCVEFTEVELVGGNHSNPAGGPSNVEDATPVVGKCTKGNATEIEEHVDDAIVVLVDDLADPFCDPANLARLAAAQDGFTSARCELTDLARDRELAKAVATNTLWTSLNASVAAAIVEQTLEVGTDGVVRIKD